MQCIVFCRYTIVLIFVCPSRFRRFAASGTTTAEEREQRVIYANILEYEQDHVSPADHPSRAGGRALSLCWCC